MVIIDIIGNNNAIFTSHFPGNGLSNVIHTTYKNGNDWGMVQMALFYPYSEWEFQEPKMEVPYHIRTLNMWRYSLR
jgi:hypothetical protein